MSDTNADVVELVDTLASGASALAGVEVQVLSSVPTFKPRLVEVFLYLFFGPAIKFSSVTEYPSYICYTYYYIFIKGIA